MIDLEILSVFFFSVVGMYFLKIREKYLVENQKKKKRSQNNEPVPVPGHEDLSLGFVVMLLYISVTGNCFSICFPHGIRLANIITVTLFTLEIEFSGNFQGML